MHTSSLLVGLVLGALALVWPVWHARRSLAAATRRESQARLELASVSASAADEERIIRAVREASTDALATQGQQLVQLAEAKYGTLQQHTDTVLQGHGRSVEEGLHQLAERLAGLERERSNSTTQLQTLVQELGRATEATRSETARLASALTDNRVRGMWGEVQLRRSLELAGLTRHVDFLEQHHVADRDGAGRPDVVVALPHGHCVVIDAKVPLDAYLRAADADDPEVERGFQRSHAAAVEGHVAALSGRDYTSKVDGSVDLVLMFLPGDAFLAAALDADPTLFERSATKGVHLVTPTSLVPVLRGISLGWREHRAERTAAEIHLLGVELHDRLALFAERFAKVGSQLERTVDAYNASVGSLEHRVAPSARRLAELGAASSRQVPEVDELECGPRRLHLLTAESPEPTAELGDAAGS